MRDGSFCEYTSPVNQIFSGTRACVDIEPHTPIISSFGENISNFPTVSNISTYNKKQPRVRRYSSLSKAVKMGSRRTNTEQKIDYKGDGGTDMDEFLQKYLPSDEIRAKSYLSIEPCVSGEFTSEDSLDLLEMNYDSTEEEEEEVEYEYEDDSLESNDDDEDENFAIKISQSFTSSVLETNALEIGKKRIVFSEDGVQDELSEESTEVDDEKINFRPKKIQLKNDFPKSESDDDGESVFRPLCQTISKSVTACLLNLYYDIDEYFEYESDANGCGMYITNMRDTPQGDRLYVHYGIAGVSDNSWYQWFIELIQTYDIRERKTEDIDNKLLPYIDPFAGYQVLFCRKTAYKEVV